MVLAVKRQNLINAENMYRMFSDVDKSKFTAGQHLPASPKKLDADLRKAKSEYLSELLFTAADLVDNNVRGAVRFFYLGNNLFVRASEGEFVKYNPGRGDGGILGAIPWTDFEKVMTGSELDQFFTRGVSVRKILSYTKDTVVFSNVLN